MFEHKSEGLLPPRRFFGRMALFLAAATGVILVALGLGMLGYHWICGLDWIDALLNAAMILTGMGPVAPMTTTAAKLFASAYALFSGVVFLSLMGVVLSPILHRVMHQVHLDDPDQPG
jgi:predicted permease